MKSLKYIMIATFMLSTMACFAQSKNQITANVKIYGNCGMCKTTIEKAGNIKNEAEVTWNKETKIASITSDSSKTSENEVLKLIALAGYDSDSYLAPDETYASLPACCHYDRAKDNPDAKMVSTDQTDAIKTSVEIVNTPLDETFTQYFAVKNALVQTDIKQSILAATALKNAIEKVKMGELSNEAHLVWMEILKSITADTKAILAANDIKKQREVFISLSLSFYKLVKVSQQKTPIYYQHCPMANGGKAANWLSQEKEVKNPYYGSMMLTFGKVVETIE